MLLINACRAGDEPRLKLKSPVVINCQMTTGDGFTDDC